MSKLREKGFLPKLIILGVIAVLMFFASFLVGTYPIKPKIVWDIIRSNIMPVDIYWADTLYTVVMQVRLPRIVAAILVGGALSISGASYQTLFKNPMVSPDLLGVSAGAGFGAALAMLHSGSWWRIQSTALVFGIVAVVMAYLIGNFFGKSNLTVLVLAGVVVSSFFQALLSIVKTLADTEDALPSITFWLMGSLGRATNSDILVLVPAALISMLLIFMFRHQINVLAAGEDEAAAMGVNVNIVKLIVVLTSTLLTVISVSICGIIGWIGMVVPHISRFLVGADYPKLAATSFFVGGIFLLLVDNLIRGATNINLPLGVVTSLIGSPIFVLLLARTRKEWR